MINTHIFQFFSMVRMGTKCDIALLKRLCRLYNSMGVFQCIQENIPVYSMVFVMFHLVGIFCGLTTYLEYGKQFNLATFGKVLHISIMCCNFAFSFLSLKETYRHDSSWECFFDDVGAFDVSIEVNGSFFTENSIPYYMEFALITMSRIVIDLLACFTSSQVMTVSYHRAITIIYIHYVGTEMMVTALVLRSLSRIVNKRYHIFVQELREIFLSTTTVIKSSNGQNLIMLYFLLWKFTVTIDMLFGKRILLIFITTVLKILVALQYAVLEYPQEKFRSFMMLILLLCQTTCTLVSC